MFSLACLIALFSTLNAEPIKTQRINLVVDGHLVSQDVTTDPDRNTALSVVGEVEGWEDFKPSVNFHDFNAGYVALKNIAEGVCLLKPISHNKHDHIPDSSELINKNGQKFLPWHKTMYWNRVPDAMTYEEVKELAGELLAEYCKDYKTYKLVPKSSRALSERLLGDDDEHHRSKRRCWVCFFCINEVDGFEQDFIDTANKDF